jgi:hypothetical protein
MSAVQRFLFKKGMHPNLSGNAELVQFYTLAPYLLPIMPAYHYTRFALLIQLKM